MTVENISISVKTNADKAATKINALTVALERLENTAHSAQYANSAVSSSMKTVAPSANSAATASTKAAKGIDDVAKSAKKVQAPMSNFVASLKRIAFYRFLRSIIKGIAQAFKEGLENVYAWSKAGGDLGRIAGALDSISSASAQMKNQLGAAFGELLAALEPVIVALINLITQLAQALTWVIALLSGKGYYPVAKQITKDWKEATGAANAYKNTILGFDEINRLNDEGGGGGGSGLGGDAFDWEPIEFGLGDFFDKTYEWLSKLKDDVDAGIGKIGDLLAELALIPDVVDVRVKVADEVPEPLLAIEPLLEASPYVVGLQLAILGNPVPILNTIRAAIMNLVAESPYLVAIESLVESPIPVIEEIVNEAAEWLGELQGEFVAAYQSMAQTVNAWTVAYAEASAMVQAETISIYNDVNSFVERTKERLQGWAIEVTETISSTFANVAENVRTALSNAATNVETFVVSTWGHISEWATSAATAVGEAFTNIAQNAYNGLQSAADNVVSFVNGAGTAIYNWASTAASVIASWARSLVKTISSAFAKAWEKVKGFAEALGATTGSYVASTDDVGVTTIDMTGFGSFSNIPLFPYGGSIPFLVPGFASGGSINNDGTLFMAGEAGTEIVANMGSKTGVMNVDQMEAAVANGNIGVINAIYGMANMIVRAVDSIDMDVTLDGQSMADKMYRYNQQAANRYGAAMVT